MRSLRNTFLALLSGRSRSGPEIPTGPEDCLRGDIRSRSGESANRSKIAPYSCQDGPSFALTSTYTLATDFVDVMSITEELETPVVVVGGRGCNERPIQISDNRWGDNAALSHSQVVDLHTPAAVEVECPMGVLTPVPVSKNRDVSLTSVPFVYK
jgi:hypothetical protein